MSITKTFIFLIAGLALTFTLVFLLYSFSEHTHPISHPELKSKMKDTVEYREPVMRYGFNEDSYRFYDERVQRNENLSEILMRYNVPYPKIHKLATEWNDVFDVRKIRAGNTYCVLNDETDSIQECHLFIYEKDPVNYVVVDLRDSVSVYRGQKEVKTEIRNVAGVINSSLYETLEDQGVSPLLAIKLSEVYAWTIDFYRIQKGDKFKVVFEEMFVDGETIGIGRIRSALFNHYGSDFYGFYFEQDSVGDYFDLEANSLRKQFLKAPLRYSRISSRYTMRRFHPVQKRYKAHLGTDYAAPTGTPIHTVGDGIVTHAQYSRFNGNYVKIRHNSLYTTQYLHMSKIKSGIRPGVRVKQGETIGYVGSTGLATGPHLCYRFWKNGSQVDPFKQEIPPAEPVKEAFLDEYMEQMKLQKQRIDNIDYPVDEPVAQAAVK